jgi:cysteine synthase A
MLFEDFIGKTPLVELPRLTCGLPGRLLVKLEFLNPLGSLKDRIARRMLDDAEARGELRRGMRLVEVSSGNTGISLASLCAARGYRLTVVMPESMSLERRTLLLLYGAEVILTPADLGLRGAIAKVREMLAADPALRYVNQGESDANPKAHETTAEEIWKDTGGEVDTIVVGAGTGGTYLGMHRYFRRRQETARVRLVAVEPSEAAILSGGEAAPHGIQGIGAGVLVPHLTGLPIDAAMTVSTEDAIRTARRVMRLEGLPVGISTGATIAAALRLAASDDYEGRLIVTIAGSSAERYLSTDLAASERASAAALPVSTLNEASLANLDRSTNPFVARGP